jgi:hypothetical protein
VHPYTFAVFPIVVLIVRDVMRCAKRDDIATTALTLAAAMLVVTPVLMHRINSTSLSLNRNVSHIWKR